MSKRVLLNQRFKITILVVVLLVSSLSIYYYNGDLGQQPSGQDGGLKILSHGGADGFSDGNKDGYDELQNNHDTSYFNDDKAASDNNNNDNNSNNNDNNHISLDTLDQNLRDKLNKNFNEKQLSLTKSEYQELVKAFEENQYRIFKKSKANATFVTLARNSDIWGIVDAIRSVEDRFNKKFHYDWIFLNDEEFSQDFIDATSAIVSGKTKYGKIPKEQWSYPDFLDVEKADKAREEMKEKGIIYGDSVSYRHMCRFESGVEPDIKFYCDIDYDLFKFMELTNQTYAFTISIYEFEATIPTLWQTTKDFLKEHPDYLHENNLMSFLSDNGGEKYNLCHFWSNFEIASLNFFRSQKYREYFDYLDKTGGFFYERWGDAPIHSIAVSLFEDRNKIHFFDDIGYNHGVYHSCPLNTEFRKKHHCSCNPDNDFTWRGYSCTTKYFDVQGLTKPAEWKDYT
ncbi:glycosyltransferase family 15 protein [Ascoidea rubescens DSM 1968]|uniref:Glycosyltransferase family 15 protein n=1 Tax=Ascoidea rubescens DSM 1968 TaxID=1344418 RepID=A0A1D2VMK8_9ASCO|nr:glycosyltransferase family 15 protein [Ascoidea rubescens DSM 1968]ODV62846.1 glycosyltransferase family 15 protein [Ascoidea rubescens DSM 1968]